MIFHFVEVALVFLLMLSVLVAAHEFGHYVFARLFGMGVEEFSIGMGGSRPILTYLRKSYRIPISQTEADEVRALSFGQPEAPQALPQESFAAYPEAFGMAQSPESLSAANALLMLESPTTDLSLDLIETPAGPALRETTDFTFRPYPIGGFVRIKGMIPQDNGEEVNIPGGFYSKAPWKRFIVLLAGPVFSIFSGILVMIPLLMTVGVAKPDLRPIIGTVMKGAADKAGLKAYDRILSIDSKPITDFYQIVAKVQSSPGIPLHLTYERGKQTFATVLTPVMSDTPTPILGSDLTETGEISQHAMMQAAPLVSHVRLSLGEASVSAAKIPVMIMNSLLGVVKRPSTARSVVGGPGTMIQVTSDAVNEGFTQVISTAALLSISVGIFNLLPVFPLDGGQMAVALAEIFRGGRRLSMRVQNTVGVVGLATVLLLVCCVLTVDYGRLFGGKAVVPPKIVSQQKLEK